MGGSGSGGEPLHSILLGFLFMVVPSPVWFGVPPHGVGFPKHAHLSDSKTHSFVYKRDPEAAHLIWTHVLSFRMELQEQTFLPWKKEKLDSCWVAVCSAKM